MTTKKRIILLPGFGEDERIFRKLLPYLAPSEIVLIDYRPVIKDFSLFTISMPTFAEAVIQYYGIKPSDILIGHSFGGYTAHGIRQLIGCEA